MTEKRFFYTDPLAAAWMAKHHGLRVGIYANAEDIEHQEGGQVGEWWDYDEVCCDLADGMIPMSDLLAEMDIGRPIYVHPDSLHLLGPKQWDIGQRLRGVPVVVCTPKNYEEYRKHGIARNYVAFGDPLMDAYFRIIQRDGKPFFWPESEPA